MCGEFLQIEVLFRDLFNGPGSHHTCIIDQNVKVSKVLNGCPEERFQMSNVTDISLDSQSLTAVLLNAANDLLGKLPVTGIIDNDTRTADRQRFCDSLPNPA
jgi:hypothetical protein